MAPMACALEIAHYKAKLRVSSYGLHMVDFSCHGYLLIGHAVQLTERVGGQLHGSYTLPILSVAPLVC